MSKMGSHRPFGHLKHKLWPKEVGKVRNRQNKSGIDLISLRVGDVRHTVGKLSRRATTFLQTSSQLEVCTGSYAPSKSRESQLL
jgi:hypothetical protein